MEKEEEEGCWKLPTTSWTGHAMMRVENLGIRTMSRMDDEEKERRDFSEITTLSSAAGGWKSRISVRRGRGGWAGLAVVLRVGWGER